MLNQLLSPNKGTFHEVLTFGEIDLSDKKFNVKSFNFNKLLSVIAEFLDQNDSILSYYFKKSGRYVDLLISYHDGCIFCYNFFLSERAYYDRDANEFEKYTLGEYFTKITREQIVPIRSDFKHIQSFSSHLI